MRSTTTATSLLLALTLSSTVRAQDNTVVDERAILIEFYQATGGPSWNDNHGWDDAALGGMTAAEVDYCDWYGVVCTGDAEVASLFGINANTRRRELQERTDFAMPLVNKVVGLELPDNFLQGRTPASLWNLPLLQYLNVDRNTNLQVDLSAAGSAPQLSILKVQNTATSSLAGLQHASPSLTVLKVTGCPLKSAVPPELVALTNLRDLQLSKCELQGRLEEANLEQLTNLRHLNLFDNDLGGSLPNAWTQLVRLEKLSVGRNQLTGDLHILEAWERLQEVFVSENQFVGSLPLLASASQLREVFMNQNKLTGPIPTGFLSGMAAASSLSENANDDDAPLIKIDLSNNQLTGSVPASLDDLADLAVEWKLHDNAFEGIATELCDNSDWNRGAISNYGCDGLLCPPGTYGVVGHASAEHTCRACEESTQYGATTCVQANDKSALLALYQATGGNNWNNNDGWKHANDNIDSTSDHADICEWYGIQCWDGNSDGDDTGGRVRIIELNGNNLQGTVPANIFSMQYLHTIKVARNPGVVLPLSNIGDSTQMRHLDISQTATVNFDGLDQASEHFAYMVADGLQLGGTLPTQLLNLTGLKLLSLAECELIGNVPSELGTLTQMYELYLYDNHLRGSLPEEVGNMQALRVLSLAQNQLTGMLPASLDSLQNLEALSLTDQVTKGGGITGPLKTFRFHPFLKSLQLSRNLLEGTIPVQLMEGAESLNNLLKVGLAQNRLTGDVPGELARFRHMDLDIEGNHLTGLDERLCANSDWMDGLVGAYGCDAIMCPAGSGGGKQRYDGAPCQACPSVGESMGGTSPNWMGQASCHMEFSIEENDEQGLVEMLYKQAGGDQWSNNQKWMQQTSNGNQIHVCEWFGISCDQSKSIVGITLGANNLRGNLPTELFMLPKLELLSVFGNDKLDISLKGIDNARNLRSLVLDSTNLKSIQGIGKARSLTELDVRNNALKGTLPEELGRLINLRSLSVSKNGFEGTIPYWISNLPSLETFLAADNKLEGDVPALSNFEGMTYVDLSKN